MNDGVVRADGVEGRRRERQCGKIRTNPKPCGHMASSKAELHLGKVDPDDVGASSKLLGDRDTGPATRVKDTCPRASPISASRSGIAASCAPRICSRGGATLGLIDQPPCGRAPPNFTQELPRK